MEDEKITLQSPEGSITTRRWNKRHFQQYPRVFIDVIRVDDPKYKKPLLVGTVAKELITEKFYQTYPMRWPIETNFLLLRILLLWIVPELGLKTLLSVGLACLFYLALYYKPFLLAVMPLLLAPGINRPHLLPAG